MNEIDLKELFKVAVETLREQTIHSLLEADMTYQKDSENEGIAEMEYLQLDLTEEQRKVCNRLLECRDKEDCEYATHSYIAGLYDALRWWELFYSCKEASPCLHSLCSFWWYPVCMTLCRAPSRILRQSSVHEPTLPV